MHNKRQQIHINSEQFHIFGGAINGLTLFIPQIPNKKLGPRCYFRPPFDRLWGKKQILFLNIQVYIISIDNTVQDKIKQNKFEVVDQLLSS